MFIGRELQLALLLQGYKDSKSHFTVLYGRRRIGKTELLKKFCTGKHSFIYNALDTTRQKQIRNFLKEFAKFAVDPLIASAPCRSWEEVFEIVGSRRPKKKFVLVLDEFQWMCRADRVLLSVIQHLWDGSWQRGNSIQLILCGSSTSFMMSEVLSQKSPLFGRRTQTLELLAMKAGEAEKLLEIKDHFEAAKYILCFGAVPAYLLLYDKKLSFEQNINRLALCENAYFLDELRYILSSQLKQPGVYHKILRILASRSCSLAELSRLTKISTGSLMYNMERLQNIGIVEEHRPLLLSENAKTVLFKISDEYTRFYFAFIHPNIQIIRNNANRFLFDTIVRDKWCNFLGLAFEIFCHKNIGNILDKLRINDLYLRSGSYWHKKSIRHGPGVQIDLVIERKDGVTLIGECRWTEKPVGREILAELEEKCRRYPNPKGHRLRKLLITCRGVAPSLVNHPELDIVMLRDFFVR